MRSTETGYWFFRLVFDGFEFLGDSCAQRFLIDFRTEKVPKGKVLGAKVGLLGASWRPPGGLLGGPGASRSRLGTLLGASWGDLGAIFWGDQILILFLTDFGSEKGPKRGGVGAKMGPKSTPKRFKIEGDF